MLEAYATVEEEEEFVVAVGVEVTDARVLVGAAVALRSAVPEIGVVTGDRRVAVLTICGCG